MGQHFESAESTGARNEVTLAADTRGHFVADGPGERQLGALPGGYRRHARGASPPPRPAAWASTTRRARAATRPPRAASCPVYRVKLDSVTIGGITLLGVEAVVLQGQGMDVALLGMSFLNRTEMRREGTTLTLTKRF